MSHLRATCDIIIDWRPLNDMSWGGFIKDKQVAVITEADNRFFYDVAFMTEEAMSTASEPTIVDAHLAVRDTLVGRLLALGCDVEAVS